MNGQKATTLWEVIMSNAESTSNELTVKLQKRITEYLSREDWRVGGVKALKGVQWAIQANDDKGRPITVYQESTPSKVTERIVVTTALTLSDDHQEKYADLSPKGRSDLIYDLRQNILLLGIGYAGLADPIEMMVFEDLIYIDDLSKGEFLRSVRKVRNASLLAATIIARRFNEPPPPEPPKPALGYHLPEK